MACQNTYSKTNCHFCKKLISNNGAARTSHFRAHVRKGEAFEINKEHPEYRGQLEFVEPSFEANRIKRLSN
jgi:hypothetical protein